MQTESKKPLVSIGAPVYNNESFIQETLESLLALKYENLEIIVADDASTDRTWDIVQTFARKDSRLQVIRNAENKGGIINWAYVLGKAKGKYFMWAGGHDKWAPDMLIRCVTLLSHNEDAILVSPQTIWIDVEGNILKMNPEEIDTRAEKTPAGRAFSMYRKMQRCNALYGVYVTEALRKALPLPNIIGPDFVLLMRIAAQGDVISCHDMYWYRRKNRIETRNRDTYKRQVGDLKITGLAARYPLLVSRVHTLNELLGFKGTVKDRAKLGLFSFWKLFLNPFQFKLIAEDVFLGFAQNRNV